MDGGYENRKMRTVKERLRGKISTVKYITPLDNRIAIPLLMREVFVETLKFCKISFMRCLFEADDEIAILARKLRCPVLSYDSDFYIHNVLYIPYVSLTLRVYKKTVVNEENYEIEVLNKKTKNKKLNNKSKSKVVVKDGKSFSIKHNSKNDVAEKHIENTNEETYCYIDCCLYKIENLAKTSKLNQEMIPLFATLLGNDYIERRMFRKFYAGVKLRRTKKKQTSQQKRIAVIIEWLRHETLKSAIEKILATMKITERDRLLRQIENAMGNYSREKSEAFDFFGFEDREETEEIVDLGIDLSKFIEANNSEEDDDDDVDESSDNEDETEEDEEDLAVEDEMDEQDVEEPVKNNEVNDNKRVTRKIEDEKGIITDEEIIVDDKVYKREENFEFPAWFTTLFMNGQLPRCVLDLFYTKMYINYPQVEDLTLPDSNEISYPLLLQAFSILHSPEKISFYYVTRVLRYARFHYKKFDINEMPHIDYDHNDNKVKSVEIFKSTFCILPEYETIFKEISQQLPNNLKLYLLCIIYWMQQCKRTNLQFLQSALIGLIALSVIDKKCTFAHRDMKVFEKKFSSQLNQPVEENVEIEDQSIKNLIKIIEKNEALHAQYNLISSYSLNEKFQRKHADFNRSVVHVYAELQSVVFNYYIISALLNYPFDNIRISECINTIFLYNVYLNLRNRTNSLDYIKQILFKKSPRIHLLFEKLYDFCLLLLPNLEDHKKYVPKLAKKNNLDKLKNKLKTKKNSHQQKKGKTVVHDSDKESSSSSDEAKDEDLLFNNKFKDLLTIE